MNVPALFGLWIQSLLIGFSIKIMSVCIFLIIYGRMLEIYLLTSIGPIPFATFANREWGEMEKKLPEIPVCARIPRLSDHGLCSHLRRAGQNHLHNRRHPGCNLELCGVYRPALLCALQNREPVKINLYRALMCEKGKT
jgi:hypothetical protein